MNGNMKLGHLLPTLVAQHDATLYLLYIPWSFPCLIHACVSSLWMIGMMHVEGSQNVQDEQGSVGLLLLAAGSW